jgi:hypothetical protein
MAYSVPVNPMIGPYQSRPITDEERQPAEMTRPMPIAMPVR